MATNIPPHNLREIIDATIQLIRHPETQLDKIMEIVQGPDFPTGGFILGRQGILDAFRTGRGSLRIRAKHIIEDMKKGDRQQIVITEIPYQVNKSRLIENAAALVNEKKIEGISEIRDESDRDGMRIVFELKRGEQPEVILNNLFKQTQLQISFGIINLSIVNGQPRELGLISTIKYFIEHRADVIRRRTDYELRKAREREHILHRLPPRAGQHRRSHPPDPRRRFAERSARIARRGVHAVPFRPRLSHGCGRHRTAHAAFAKSRLRPSSNCSSSASPVWSARRSRTNSPTSSGASANTWKSWAPRKSCATS